MFLFYIAIESVINKRGNENYKFIEKGQEAYFIYLFTTLFNDGQTIVTTLIKTNLRKTTRFFFNKKTIFCLSLNILKIMLEIRLKYS